MKTTIPGYAVHPAADLFPMLSDEELTRLADDIAENGQRVPITTYFDPATGEELLLDGRNRALACIRAGRQPISEVYRGSDPLGLVIGLNVHRRHLSKSQLAIAAARCMPMYKERAELRMKAGKAPSGNTPAGSDARDEAGRDFNVSGSLVQRAARVLETGDVELIDQVDLGVMTVSAAYDEIKRPGDPDDDADFAAASEDPEDDETEGGFEDVPASGESPGTTEEPADEDAPILVDGLEVDLKLSQWFTSDRLANRLVEELRERPKSVFEPAAGSGALIDALHRRWPDVPVMACELDPRWADRLHERTPEHVDVRCVDALTFDPGDLRFDWALLNPPYEDGLDVRFLRHAMDVAQNVVGVFRVNILSLKSAKAMVWGDGRWHWNVKFLAGRPKFNGVGGARHDYVVVYGRRIQGDFLPQRSFEWWEL